MSTLSTLDWIVISAYFGVIGLIAWWASRRQRNTEDYFLAGRNVGFFAVGCSLLASNVGSEHIVGLAGSGAKNGMGMAHYELHAWIMVLLAYFFVPFYYRSGVFTMPEFLERRFDQRARWILSLVSLTAYVLTKVSVTIYAGAVVFEHLLPDTFGSKEAAFWVGAFSTVILTGAYTVFGGMRAVIYTESLQTIVFLIGASVITFFGLSQLGGWGELQTILKPHAKQFALWRPLSDPDFPWLGVMIASPIVGIWYWCTDQYIVQRTLAAKNLATARRGALFGGLLKVSPVFIFLVPGMIGFALQEKGFLTIPLKPKEAVTDFDQVFPMLVTTLLPSGFRGLVVACLLAALMSSLASLFNSAATLFTVDIYEKLRPGRSERFLVNVGRLATVTVVGLGMLWIPVMAKVHGGGLYVYLQSVQGYLAPPITAVFLLGLLWSRINAQGAVWGLIIGFVVGMAKLMVQTFFGNTGEKLASPSLLATIGDFNSLYAAGLLFVVSTVIVVGISLMTAAPDPEKIRGLTWRSAMADSADELRKSWDLPNKLLATTVLGIVAAVYLYFSFWLD